MSFSTEMTSRCAKALKFLAPHLEKLMNPSYQTSTSDLETLQKHIQGIVSYFRSCPATVQQEYFTVRDDVEALYRLDDLISQYRAGTIQLSMKTTLSDVQKRLIGIKVGLNKDLGKAPKKSPVAFILILCVALGVAWFFKGTLVSLVGNFTNSKPETETILDAESDADSDADQEADAGDDSENEPLSETSADAGETAIDSSEEETAREDAQKEQSDEAVDSTKDDENANADESEEESEIGLKTGKFDVVSPNRAWTDVKGNKTKGQLDGVEVKTDEDVTIYLKSKGIRKGYPLEKFSEKDQAYVLKRLEKTQKKAD